MPDNESNDKAANGPAPNSPATEQAPPGAGHGEAHPALTLAVTLLILMAFAFILVSRRYLAQIYHWPGGVEQIRYLALLELFKDSFFGGNPYPRWAPDLFFGYGYPVFIFYPPGYFYLATAVSIPLGALAKWIPFFADHMAAEWIVCVSILLAGGMGAYLLCETLSGGRVGLYSAMLFLMSPYLLANLQARSDLAELLALSLCPYPFYFFHRMIVEVERGSGKAGRLATLMGISLGVIFISHPAVALFLCVTITIYGFSVSALSSPGGDNKLTAAILLACAIALGLTISAPYWLHVFLLKPMVNLQKATVGYVNVDNWVASPHHFIMRDDGYFNYYELGLPHLVLCVIGAATNYRDPRFAVAFLLYAAAVLSLTELGAGWWSYFNLVKYVQFPWRVQSILVTLQIICIAGIWKKFPAGPGRLTPAMAAAVFFVLFWHRGSFQWPDRPIPFYPQSRLESRMRSVFAINDLRFNTFSNTVEYAPLYALNPNDYKYPRVTPIPRPAELAQAAAGACRVAETPASGKYRIQFTAAGQEPCRVRINQIYFPGWIVSVDGKPLDGGALLKNANDDGTIKFNLPPGAHTVEARYEGPPHWRARNALMAAMVALYFIVVARVNGWRPPAGARRAAR